MKNILKIRIRLLCIIALLFINCSIWAQKKELQFGERISLNDITTGSTAKATPVQWIDVNTSEDTWMLQNDMLICSGLPVGVMRSVQQYENFILHIEWMHMESGGNSGVFVWSAARPGLENRLPNGVEVQMLELDWVKLNKRDGATPPVAYVHGELFGVGGVTTTPDNPRGERSKSIENLCKGRGEWNVYDVICVDGVIKLSVNGKFVNGVAHTSQKKGYLCLESEGAPIHFRNLRIIELPPGVTVPSQVAPVAE